MARKISVIYVNYNTSVLLINSVHSLKEHCSEGYEIIIVDNNSTGEQQNILHLWLKEREKEDIRVVFSEKNLGFAGANNLGASHAGGEYLFFLNPDTLVLNDVIGLFSKFMSSADPAVAACGGNLLSANHRPVHSFGNFPSLAQEICNIGLGISSLIHNYHRKNIAIGVAVERDEVFEVPYIVGADIFIRTQCFKHLNGFDDQYFMYYEETDLFYRLKKAGYQSFIVPEAKIVHLEGGALGYNANKKFNTNKFEMILQSKLYYFKKFKILGYSILKIIILKQIMFQFIKGNMGRDLMCLLRIYFKAIHIKSV